MSEEQYASEFERDHCAAILGAYHGKDIAACEEEGPGDRLVAGAGGSRPHGVGYQPPALDRNLVFSGGRPEVRIVDFYEDHGQYADHYCSVVSARGYRQGNDYVPHDARVHEWGTGKTRLETLIALGRKPVLVPDHKVEDGINAAHLMFKRVGP